MRSGLTAWKLYLLINTVPMNRIRHGFIIIVFSIQTIKGNIMCGIAGRILAEPGQVGADLVNLMHAQRHRGADSTGLALYGKPRENGYGGRAMTAQRKNTSVDP